MYEDNLSAIISTEWQIGFLRSSFVQCDLFHNLYYTQKYILIDLDSYS